MNMKSYGILITIQTQSSRLMAESRYTFFFNKKIL